VGKRIVFIVSFVFIYSACLAQIKLTQNQKLESLAKVWGFLKYYHPSVASGKLDWDSELIRHVPKVKAARSKEKLSRIYLEWIARLGEIKEAAPAESRKTFDRNFNLDWTDNRSLFTDELISKLDFIEKNRHQGPSHYVTVYPIGIIDKFNEEAYPNLYFKYPDEGFRLLTLFRYWNIIEYFFPYKYVADQNWDDVLAEMIPKFRDAKSLSEYHLAVVELIAKVDDSHAEVSAEYAPEIFGSYFIPGQFEIIDNKAVITDYYNDSLARVNDIRVGDVIHRVDGEMIEDIIERKSKYICGSNKATKLRGFRNAVFNGETDKVEITFERNGILQEKQVKRYEYRDFGYTGIHKESKWKIMKDNIGYVDLGILEIPDVALMMESLLKCKAIIFDVRNYPNGTMDEIANYLNSAPRPYAKFTLPDMTYPGKYYWLDGDSAGRHNRNSYAGQVVLLVNEHTQSYGEFTVMALQTANNAIVVGSQTAGADGNIIFIDLPGKIETRITGIGVFYPDGKETQRIGIVPDAEVKLTIEGIRKGKDEVLEKAIAYIEKKQVQLLNTPKR
jgi:carboxyl-terminal processing protease